MPIQQEILNELLLLINQKLSSIKKMSLNNLSWEKLENPSKAKLKEFYLNKYRIKLGLFTNHKEQLPKSKPKQRNISIKELDHLVKPEIVKARMITDNYKVLTAQLINKITQKQQEQENFCIFPQIKQKKTKKRSKTEQHQNNQYNKQQKALARTAYLIVQ
ncbi:unnamed protein product (macronuclear) [Paramecium tetraurelia]|uniref:Uncharacterized protein n=1 Tax=Paramecium tetraurelia TaxID=5888 RepID=A0DPY8_PARTE|nr:uncharacterized protein GSPATT00002504001 [Paramecium tetraurelia]CAK85105.1 unnamed protein product [Paramecium tetraurelia]|eukprot:XP_001452502.1 hypothetical protein (macronuclear) [Paramecium tetraurelia strain d4-2]